jgi:2-polyprenyl-3-methyl-5-hydroxy-6-metoxy-1,4-benzoquinol methylase
LEKARKQAETEGLKVEFIQEDMRSFCKPNTFDVVIKIIILYWKNVKFVKTGAGLIIVGS